MRKWWGGNVFKNVRSEGKWRIETGVTAKLLQCARGGEIDKKREGGRAREREEGKEGREDIAIYRRESEGECV